MKYFVPLIMLFIPLVSEAQFLAENQLWRPGFVLNNGFNGETYTYQVTPSLTFSNDHSQWEMGYGFNPLKRVERKLSSVEINYKYFPNGQMKKFNLYLLTQLSYTGYEINTYYHTKYQYLFLHMGYGFQIKLFEGGYLGTHMSLGAFTYQKQSDVPYEGFDRIDLWEEAGMNLTSQFHLGYRF